MALRCLYHILYLITLSAVLLASASANAQSRRPDRKPLPRHVAPVAHRHDSTVTNPDSLIWSAAPEQIEAPASFGEKPVDVVTDEFTTVGDSLRVLDSDTIPVIAPFDRFAGYNEWEERDYEYNPSPTRAVWMSALFPGLGQIYNRRYWKLPILVGGYLGLGYATSWNNGMLRDYTRAYRDIMDTDPDTKSYMDFFPSTVKEEDLDKNWLTSLLKSRKDYYRRNRDLCIICMVGVYFVAMVDAYVDASLSHFDITPELSIDWAPALIQDRGNKWPSVGLQWAFNF